MLYVPNPWTIQAAPREKAYNEIGYGNVPWVRGAGQTHQALKEM